MKLVSIALARSVWLFDFGQFNPKGLNLWPVCERLIKKYSFAGHPKNLLDVDSNKALTFQAGSFTNTKGENVAIGLSIYANGLAADTLSSTDDAADFLQQVAGSIAKEFGLIVPSNVGRVYLSQLEVEVELLLSKFNERLAKFANDLTGAVATVDGKPRKFDFGTLQLWTDDWNVESSPAYFRFERKIGLPFSSNRYFSQAALKTHEHLDFLKVLEDILTKG